MAKEKRSSKVADKKKKNIKEVEIEENIEEFDDEEFDFDEEEDFEEEVTSKKKVSKVVEDDEESIELTMEERIISIEKKQNIILVFVLITALLSLFTFITGLSGNRSYSDDKEKTDTDTQHPTSSTYDTSAFTKVKAQDLEKLSKKDTIIVWIGRQGCGYCAQFAPTITTIGEKLDETIYYLDLAEVFDFSTNPVGVLDEEAYNLLANFQTDGKTENKDIMQQLGATPMTLVIKKNKIVGNFVGAYDEATALQILKDEGFKEK